MWVWASAIAFARAQSEPCSRAGARALMQACLRSVRAHPQTHCTIACARARQHCLCCGPLRRACFCSPRWHARSLHTEPRLRSILACLHPQSLMARPQVARRFRHQSRRLRSTVACLHSQSTVACPQPPAITRFSQDFYVCPPGFRVPHLRHCVRLRSPPWHACSPRLQSTVACLRLARVWGDRASLVCQPGFQVLQRRLRRHDRSLPQTPPLLQPPLPRQRCNLRCSLRARSLLGQRPPSTQTAQTD